MFECVIHRLMSDLKETHLLPLEESRTYTLSEFKNILMIKREEFLKTLEKLSWDHAVVLNVVPTKVQRVKCNARDVAGVKMKHMHNMNSVVSPGEGILPRGTSGASAAC